MELIGSGAPREWLVPLDTEGNRSGAQDGIEGEVVGCHTGVYAGLNGVNLQPGFEYGWEVNPTYRGEFNQSAAFRISGRGGQIVKTSDPESPAQHFISDEMTPAETDSAVTYNELVFVRYPTDSMQREREDQEVENQRRLRRGPEAGFVQKGSHRESEFSGGRGPIRFQLSDHHSELQQDGRAEEIITPDSSVIPRVRTR